MIYANGHNNIKKVLASHQKELKSKFGIKAIGLFGSAVRNELKTDSDIDIIVEFENERGDMYDFIGLVDFLENLFNRSVDVLTPAGIKSIRIERIKQNIQREIEYV